MYASFSIAPSPIATGPCTRQRSSRAPFATETRPSSSESTTSPSITGSTASSRRRLVSSMSSHLPVSFHQPVTTCGSTRFPSSISAWIASVISYSPRLGRLERPADVEDARLEHVDADEREVGLRHRRLLLELDDPFAVELRDAEGARVVDVLEEDQRVRLRAPELLDHRLDPVPQQVVAEVDDERGAADRVLGGQHRVGKPERPAPARRSRSGGPSASRRRRARGSPGPAGPARRRS